MRPRPCCITALALAAGLSLAPTPGAWADPAPPAPVDLGSRRELFVDDHLIDRLDGARLKLHEPRPANVVLRNDRPWEGAFNFGLSVVPHGGGYRMYYRAIAGTTIGGRQSLCVAESADDVTWAKPSLGAADVGGSRDNNAVAGPDGRPVPINFDVWPDARPGVPPAERYKGVSYLAGGRPQTPTFSGRDVEHRAVFHASADGVRFQKMDPQPDLATRLRNAFDSQNVYFWSSAEGQYVCYFRWYDVRRTVARTTSKDLRAWTDPAPMTYGDTPREHVYTNQTLPYPRAPHLYVGLAARFVEGRRVLTDDQVAGLKIDPKHKQPAYTSSPSDAVLLTSRAGSTRYDRTFLESLVRPGPGAENWVGRSNYPLWGLVETGPAELSFYVNRHYMQPTWHVQRYTVRTDGFASLHGPYKGGEAVTKPFTFTGRSLNLNYATGAAGSVRVEVQDAAGRPVEGFGLADSGPIAGDEVSRAVAWKGGADVGRLAGRPVRLRFVLRDADVYSFRFE